MAQLNDTEFRQGDATVVVVSEEELAGWQETVHLLHSPRNAARLLDSVAQADANQAAGLDLIAP